MNQSGREAIMDIQSIEEKIERLLVIMNDQADLYFSEAEPEASVLKFEYDNAVKRHFTCYEMLLAVDESLCDAIEALLESAREERRSNVAKGIQTASRSLNDSEGAFDAV